MKRILFTGNTLSEVQRNEYITQGFEFVPASYDLSEDEVANILQTCDGYILGGDEIVTESMLAKAGNRIRAISFFGAGYEKYIDVNAAKKHGIMVANTPGANANSVAEFTVALLLATIKRVVPNSVLVKNGLWDRPQTQDLKGKTVGIIGLGNIGKIVARILFFGFGMNIVYYSRHSKPEIEEECQAKFVELDELLQVSDVISIHSSLTEETRNLISEREFDMMKAGVIIIDTARVEIIDEEALCNALNKGHDIRCAFDGFYTEPIDSEVVKNHALLQMDNSKIIVTPHMAYYTSDAISRMEKMAIDNILEMLSTGTCSNLVI